MTQFKQLICDVIRDDGRRSPANRIFSNAITILIIVNIVMVILDLLSIFPDWFAPFFFWIEAVSVAVFTIEYILRIWTADLLFTKRKPGKARLRYAISPMALVDLVAILPFYLPLAFPINMTILRFLRLLRLLRILKLNRFSESKTAEKILASVKEAIIIVDMDQNFLSANESARALFPCMTEIKKYTPVGQVTNWPDELKAISENKIEGYINFILNGDNHYQANVSLIYDREKLLRYIIIIHDITESVRLERAEKERIKSELATAAKIQASLLPNVFPPFPERNEFDLFALMNPAKEVGGDFYDFFMIDDNKLAVVMADVSGKGIPAALFMVNAKTQLKNSAERGESLVDVMEKVNNLMCVNNDECMFVTVFIGILDIPTGKFSFVNGGHDVPLLKRCDGSFEWLETRPGFMLGFMEDSEYVQDEIILGEGDTLFLYTDGVTEAYNPNEDVFTEERLIKEINEQKCETAEDLVTYVRGRIDIFANNADQFDDITMLALKINTVSGGKKRRVMIIDDDVTSISTLTHILRDEYSVFAESKSLNAVEAINKVKPHLVLLDVLMPEKDGYQILSELKNSELTKNIPVILVTSLHDTHDEAKGLELGAADYITKPYDKDVVKLRVKKQM